MAGAISSASCVKLLFLLSTLVVHFLSRLINLPLAALGIYSQQVEDALRCVN